MRILRKLIRPFLPRADLHVFGSSILWGQGNRTKEKIHALVADAIEDRRWVKVRPNMWAHSGAMIRGDDPGVRLHGEVPWDHPSIEAQISAAPASDSDRVVVLIEGGINEVGATRIVSPSTGSDYITSETARACGEQMRTVLGELTRKFPRARVFLLGYYPIISRSAGEGEVRDFLRNEDAAEEPAQAGFVDRTVENCRLFVSESDRHLRRVAEEANGSFKGSCVFVPSGFGDGAAMFGPESLLFPPWSGDPMFARRAGVCTSAIRKGRTGVHCYLAAAAHPNPRGCRRYAEQIIRAMDGPEAG